MSGCRYVEEISSAAMLATKRSGGVAPEMDVNEHVIWMPLPIVIKATHNDLEPRRNVTRSLKWEYQWPTENDLCPSKLKMNYVVDVTSTCCLVM